MSKFAEHFGEEPDPNWRPEEGWHERWLVAKAAWNARGEVDAEICRKAWHDDSIALAEAIEQEQVK